MRTWLLLLTALLGACDLNDTSGTADTGWAGDGIADICHVIPDGGPGACFAESSPIPYRMLGPNVQLVVDRSGSMKGAKWRELKALTAFLPEVGTRANLGLSLFSTPGAQGCDTKGSKVVPMSEGVTAAPRVAAAIKDASPDGSTPIAGALERLIGDPALQCPNRDNIVVLLTDGRESCGGHPESAVHRLTSQEQPIELYVIGFGTDAATNKELKGIARAARPTTGPDNFYTASTAEELVYRLAAVTATCTAQIDGSFDPGALLVTLDGREIPPCTEDRCEAGFSVDEEFGNVRIEGADCLALLDGQCHDLRFDHAAN